MTEDSDKQVQSAAADIWPRYRAFLKEAPRMVVEWQDEPTGARGWLILNSLRGGAAGGGTRMRVGVTREEVVYLAKAMELKFAFSGPQVGGGKSGIDFDPADPRKREVLKRWFTDMRPLMKEIYGTGGDVNVDEQREVAPICAEVGLANPQQGIVAGHLCVGEDDTALAAAVQRADHSLRHGLALQVHDPELGIPGADFRVSDLATGYGVSRAAAALLGAAGAGSGTLPLDGVRVIVEGFGTVGGPAALYLARLGARIVGVTDARHGLAVPGGLGAGEVEALLRRRTTRDLPDDPRLVHGEARDDIYAVEADLFVPAAISGSLTADRVAQLHSGGVKSIVCGANQPFREARFGATETVEDADRRFAVVPDALGSMGMARAFHFLMADGPAETPEQVLEAIDATMTRAVTDIIARNGGVGPGLLGTTYLRALERIESSEAEGGPASEVN